MDAKKKAARLAMLKAFSAKKSSEMNEPKAEVLKKKKLSKVTVIADDKEGLEKGLTKAQQILKAKLGKLIDEKEEDETEEISEHDCEECEDEGCELCEEEEESEEDAE